MRQRRIQFQQASELLQARRIKRFQFHQASIFLKQVNTSALQNVWRARNSYGRVKDMDSLQPMKDPEEKKETEIQCFIFKFKGGRKGEIYTPKREEI